MTKSITYYKMLILCPSDVVDFLDEIQKTVLSFNLGFGRQNGFFIETKHWPNDDYSNMTKRIPEHEEIKKQFLSEADLLFGFFETSFGASTEECGLNTEEVIDFMLDKGKPVIIYFLRKTTNSSKIDGVQSKRINEFKNLHKNDKLYRILEDKTVLSLRLRKDLEQHVTEMQKRNKKSLQPSQQKTILWVDDNPENNIYGRKRFENSGIEVVSVLSTKQALHYLEHNKVSVIISDMIRKEGKTEGYVLLDALREKSDKTPFLIFSGSKSKKYTEDTIRHGGQGNTNDFSELFSMVSDIIGGRRN